MLISALVVLSGAPADVPSPVIATSMFKNGYAMVLRDIKVSGTGEYRLASIPAASLGTLWFAGGEGVEIDSVKTVNDVGVTQADASSLGEIIAANVGKEVRLGIKEGDNVTGQIVTGKLLSAGGEVVIVQTSSSTVALQKALVTSIASAGGELLYKVPRSSYRRTLQFGVKGAGHISMVSLEKGISWVPGYAIDVTNKDKLSLVAKATVLNDDEDLKNVTAKFVTGFPNVPYAAFQDPLTSGETIDQFLGLISSPVGFSGSFGGVRDARAKLAFTNQAAAPLEVGANMPISPVIGEQLEDLFFYEQPNVTLDKGQRSYYVLFRAEAPYKQIYTCDLPDPIINNIEFRPGNEEPPAPDVWHTLAFKNTSGKPLTTAPAVTFKSGQIIGQDTMSYVSSGGEAEVKVTKALDVRASTSEEEVSRERGAIKAANNYPLYDLVTLKGAVAVNNMKTEPVTLRIRHEYTGELVSAEGDPVNRKSTKGLRETNPGGRLTWNKTVAPGQTLILNYSYKVYIRSQ